MVKYVDLQGELLWVDRPLQKVFVVKGNYNLVDVLMRHLDPPVVYRLFPYQLLASVH